MSPRPARRVADLERTLIRRIFDAAPPDAINLGLGQPDLPTPAVIAEAGIEAIREGRTDYTSSARDPGLREAIARHYAPFARGPENVVVTVGSQEAMFVAVMCLVDPGDEVLYPDPGYPAYPTVVRLVGAEATPYPLRPERGFRLDARDVLSRIGDRTRAVILCSPANPTGAVHEAAEVEGVVRALEKRGVAWLSDEIYAGFVYEGDAPSPRGTGSSEGVVVSSLSKDYCMTGWRVGWAVGPAELMARAAAAHQHLVTCAPSISQHAARAAFTEAGMAEARSYLEIFRRRRALMAEELGKIEGLAVRSPDGAFYFFVDVSRFGDSLEISRRILENRGVVTIPGEAFGAGGAGWLRLSFAASERDIVRGVRAVGEELAGLLRER